ncbi:MAG: hypothetical protein U9R52_01460 [Candidatus Omnitrophota bacterium]|nr:hypothetical protein [Candidatus Omnitrophota bacterium]
MVLEPSKLARAHENIFEVSFERFRDTVVSYLAFEEQSLYTSPAQRGIWVDPNNQKLSPYAVVPFLLPRQRCYVSFVSALHLHHMVEQIPQVITLASTSHTKTINTKMAAFCIHQLTPSFFKGFDWYKKTGSFLIAEPEKAFVDCLYLSAYKKSSMDIFLN